jgi:hypothetical protein
VLADDDCQPTDDEQRGHRADDEPEQRQPRHGHRPNRNGRSTTLNLYSHLWPGDEDRIRQAVDQALPVPAEDSLRTAGTEE